MNKESILSELKNLQEGLPYADGLAYSQDTLRIQQLHAQLQKLEEINKSVLHDSHVMMYNVREIEKSTALRNEARKKQISEAVKYLSERFS